ncbi:hypothetical protein EBX93_08965, partial [bacterium]|nr:hypothetical protein [bacterium]
NRKNNQLKLRNNPNLKSIYPMLDEFGYHVVDFFIFKSTWDYGYHFECEEDTIVEDINPNSIKGVISISGVYEIPQLLLGNVFGKDPQNKIKASPITHVRKELPPFLLLCADKELPLCTKTDCQKFQKALIDNGNIVIFEEISSNNHMKMVFDAGNPTRKVANLILQFCKQVATQNKNQ